MSNLALGNLWAWTTQVGVIVAVGGLLPLGLRITSPRARAVLLRSILVACLVLPAVQPWIPSPMPAADLTLTPLDASAELPAGATTVQRSDDGGPQAWLARWRSMAPGWPLETMVISIVMAGVVLRIGWLALGLLSLSRLRRLSSELQPGLRAPDEAAALVGASAPVRVSPRVVRPVTFGLREPVVLVPPDFLGFDPVHQTAILAHEFLHVQRRDWIRTVGDELVRSVLWFHPAIWWLIDQIHLSVEQVIDRQVVDLMGARKPYLEALLKLAAAGRSPMLQPAASFLTHGHLARRVALLVQEVAMSRIRLGVSLAVALTVLVTGGWFVVQAFPLRAVPAAPTVAEQQRDTVTLDFQGSDIRAVLQTFSTMTGHEMKIDPGISGTVDLSIRDVPWEQALEIICRSNRLVYRLDGTVIRVERLVNTAIGMSSGLGRQSTPTVDRKHQMAKPGMLTPTIVPAEPGGWAPVNAVRVGGSVRPPRKVKHVGPVYPLDALAAKVEGVVILEAVIDEDGKVVKTRVLRSIPLLDQAARDAVQQWEFTPKLVSGVPVPVVMTTTLTFTLAEHDAAPGVAGGAGGGVAGGVSGGVAGGAGGGVAGGVASGAGSGVAGGVFGGVAGGAGGGVAGGAVSGAGGGVAGGVASGAGGGVAGGVASGAGGGVAGRVAGGAAGGVVRSDPVALDPTAVRVGGEIKPPAKLMDARPVHPVEAKEARVQGVVIAELLIGVDGTVEKAHILRSIPMLDEAALDAVKQWMFEPTLQNGTPVKVIMTVTVNFILQ